MKVDVCICSDDEIFAHLLACELRLAGFSAATASKDRPYPAPVRLYLLDADTPGLPALAPEVPVLRFSSAKGSPAEFVRPFQTSELVLQVASLLGKAAPAKKPPRGAKSKPRRRVWTLSDGSRSVTTGGKALVLSPREYLLFKYLYEKGGTPVSREEAALAVWGKVPSGTNVVDVYVYYLREKLEKTFGDKVIHTVRGKGYAFRPRN